MPGSLSRLMDVIKIITVFVALTLFFYVMIVWVADALEEHSEEDRPKGRAVKVFNSQREASLETIHDVKDRLMFFYWFGE
ncbi:hypothetical protein CathTA2_2024 [Caldalkalibacillus thermarum TA2.A1]|uniref:YqzK family protein n=1 Tax=Caldalkalibacillus thermarum (strain TA2.A1) TaxID=986075 RepID=F5L872_CALTT|nr:DUF4227 family protein [Caldalkalibacillus thermarum]EGL82485.1 hypothetical protein CathTA2_2024 [Caldalkalibacillus thermarum TA2.A1]QZT33168.1 YqzK family protein [Caldalkalibacillus thermarum TA2.A1]